MLRIFSGCCILVVGGVVGCSDLPLASGGNTEDRVDAVGSPASRTHWNQPTAEAVLGFDTLGAWRTDGALVSKASAPEASGGLRVSLEGSGTLTSESFSFQRTPNLVSLAIQPLQDQGTATVSAFLECLSKEVNTTHLGTVELGESSGSRSGRVDFPVSAELRDSLAGGCESLVVKLEFITSESSATYLLDGMTLRAFTPPIAEDSSPLCGLPNTDALVSGATETPEGYWDYQQWIGRAAPQAELPLLEKALEPFADVALEPTFDDVNQQVVIAVDPQAFTTGKVREALQSLDIALPLRIQPACNPLNELRTAGAVLTAGDWGVDTPAQRYSSYLDSARGKWIVRLDPSSVELTLAEFQAGVGSSISSQAQRSFELLSSRLNHVAEVEWGRAARHDRMTDGERHYGGAAIGPNMDFRNCTAGFVVRRNGAIGSVTAAHCFSSNGVDVFSGFEFYGVTAGRAAFPQFDLTRIDPDGETYTNVIHTGPSAPITRTQLGRSNPAIGTLVCISGYKSGARCGAQVTTNTASICDTPTSCTNNLTRAVRTGVVINQNGDSGAPIYTQSGATGAIIRGMNVGVSIDDATDETLFHRVTVVESTLGVTVVTP